MADTRAVPLSARIPLDDATFLAKLSIDGAVTPSDKLRAIISQARSQHERGESYEAALAAAREWLAPAAETIHLSEARLASRSKVIGNLLDWLPPLLAHIVSYREDRKDAAKSLAQLERQLVAQSFALFDALLRLAITENAPAHDPAVVRAHLPPLLDLARLLLEQPVTKAGGTRHG